MWVTWGSELDPGLYDTQALWGNPSNVRMGGLLRLTAHARGNTGVGQEHVTCVAFLLTYNYFKRNMLFKCLHTFFPPSMLETQSPPLQVCVLGEGTQTKRLCLHWAMRL